MVNRPLNSRRYGLHSGNLFCKRLDAKGLVFEKKRFIADGSVDDSISFVELHGSATGVDVTLPAPLPGRFLVISCSDSTNDCTATLAAGTFDGTNDVATFADAGDALVLFGVSATRYIIIENIGTVTFS
jgi:hypothetical protein